MRPTNRYTAARTRSTMRRKKQPISRFIKNQREPDMSVIAAESHDEIKIAIVQTGSWGDNVNSTLMLKPLKAKYPNCRIEVHTSTYYASAFTNNPLIDKLVKHPSSDKNSSIHLSCVVTPKLTGYDIVFNPHPMYNGDKWTSIKHPELGTNLILAWVRALEDQDVEYQLPLETVLRLTNKEINKVNAFCEKVPNFNNSRNILMEVAGESGQSFWNPSWTVTVGRHLLDGNTNLFISRRENSKDVLELQQHSPGRVFFAGGLTIRECAELYNKCQAFFSVSSGLSNACNTDWGKNDIIWIETTNSEAVTSAPVRSEGKTFWHNNDLNAFVTMLRERSI